MSSNLPSLLDLLEFDTIEEPSLFKEVEDSLPLNHYKIGPLDYSYTEILVDDSLSDVDLDYEQDYDYTITTSPVVSQKTSPLLFDDDITMNSGEGKSIPDYFTTVDPKSVQKSFVPEIPHADDKPFHIVFNPAMKEFEDKGHDVTTSLPTPQCFSPFFQEYNLRSSPCSVLALNKRISESLTELSEELNYSANISNMTENQTSEGEEDAEQSDDDLGEIRSPVSMSLKQLELELPPSSIPFKDKKAKGSNKRGRKPIKLVIPSTRPKRAASRTSRVESVEFSEKSYQKYKPRKTTYRKRATKYATSFATSQFICTNSSCGKTFTNKALLSRHINCVHLKLERFSCEYCHKKFTRSDHLSIHIKRMH